MEIKGIILDFGKKVDGLTNHKLSNIIKEGYIKAGIAVDDALFLEAHVYGEQELARTSEILPEADFANVLLIRIKIELGYLASHGHFPPALVDEKAAQVAGYCYDAIKQNLQSSIEILKQLSEKYPLVLLSEYFGKVSIVLKEFGIDTLFKKIIDLKEQGLSDSDPSVFEMAAKYLKCHIENVLVIGDRKEGLLTATKIGCNAIALENLQSSALSKDDNAAIRHLEEILKFTEAI